ncbi:MAG TPA: tetratricopeptide repeat protein [Pirellulales bacterium]|nr:tetratricopeptide repeat protein [Pirellulales bacterium]
MNLKTAAAAASIVVMISGCGSRPTPARQTASIARSRDSRQDAEIFAYVAGILNGLDQFDTAVAERDDMSKLNAAARRLIESGVPPSLTSQLNQWASSQPAVAGWRREPMLVSLPDELRQLPQLKQLKTRKFSTEDGFSLREAVWLRDISQMAGGRTQDDVELAAKLFDWVVRNIQLDADPSTSDDGEAASAALPTLPWQTLLLGHGMAIDRAWLFTLLARQQGMDVVILDRADLDRAEAPAGAPPLGLSALLSNGELYLFDTALGLPIPGPGGKGVATLAQAVNDETVLRQLDLDSDQPYRLKDSDLAEVAALIEASPMYLCERMALVEQQLSSEQKVVLSADASGVARRVSQCAHVATARLWTLPLERADAIRRGARKVTRRLVVELEPFAIPYFEASQKRAGYTPALWRGRTLHLFGKCTGAESASRFYQIARPADAEFDRWMAGRFEEVEQLMQVNPDEHRRQKEAAERFVECARIAKQDASYWLGLIAFQREDYPTAIDYLGKRTLEASPDGPWTSGAWYNLGRSYEALGQIDEAVGAYRQGESVQRIGNLLRAKRLGQTAVSKE